jgi:uncharacterized phage protein (TIGR02216 family)
MLALAQRLGVSPPRFWRLSLTEWRALVAPAAADVLTRTAFDGLIQRFPDQ